jgi:hypothetical protein
VGRLSIRGPYAFVTAAASVAVLCSCASPSNAETVLSGRYIATSERMQLQGEFVNVDGCVHVRLEDDGQTYPLLWPSGTVLSPNDPTQIDLLNGSVSLIRVPDNIQVTTVPKNLMSDAVQRGEFESWDHCVSDDDETILVITSVSGISLPD